MMWMILTASFAAQVTCSVNNIKSSVCWALCRRDGYDSGHYDAKSDKCACITLKDFSEYTKPTLEIYHNHGSTD